ncbi:MAG TPA: hypothetical protein VFW73_02450 [Lacipirellulaceae bacterium]|nr:hypothetical protein [Lacipirellulaceae bacterium]
MRTKRSQTVLLIIFAQLASMAVYRGLRAATPDDSSQSSARPVVQKPLTREDAELMLREAHGLIEQGRFDDADKIISRVENAHVQFPLFHFGPTTASLRKQLMRAQRLSAARKSLSHDQPAATGHNLPFSRNSVDQTNATADPFIAHSRVAQQIQASGNATQQDRSIGEEHRLAAVSSPTTLALNSEPSGAQRLNNPFVSSSAPISLPSENLRSASSASNTPLQYPSTHEAIGEGARNLDASSSRHPIDSSLPESARSNSSWALPSAPLPRGANDQRFAENNSGLMPPRHMAASSSLNSPPSTGLTAKQQAQEKLSAARNALQSGDIDLAEKLTQAANSIGVPESQFLPDEDRPSLVAGDIARAKQQANHSHSDVARSVAPASRYELPSAQSADYTTPSSNAHRSDVAPVAYGVEEHVPQSSATTPIPLPPVDQTAQTSATPAGRQTDDGPQMLAALPAKPVEKQSNSAPRTPSNEEIPLPPPIGSPAATNTNNSSTPSATPIAAAKTGDNASDASAKSLPAPNQPHKSFIDSADEAQQMRLRKLDAEVLKRQSEAVRLREKDSERALATLREAQQMVNSSNLPDSQKRELLSRIDKTLHDTQEYVKSHGAQIELDKQNEAVLDSVDRDRDLKIKLQQKIADQVNEYNSLNHEQRYAESEIIARRLHELAPDEPVVAQVWQESKFLRRERMNNDLQDKREDSFWRQLNSVEESAVNPVADDGRELVYDQKHWSDFVAKRKGSKDRLQHHSERELEIERRLQTPVLLRYDNTPLSEVMHSLSQLASVNIHLDPRGLSQEGVNSETPVTINLSKEISLKSALNLILEPLHLSYVVSDEVLKITSEQLRDGELITET